MKPAQLDLFASGQHLIPRARTCPKCRGPMELTPDAWLCRSCGIAMAGPSEASAKEGGLFGNGEDKGKGQIARQEAANG